MTRITLADFKKLKGGNYDGLYHALISCTTANTDGTVQVDDSKIKGQAFQNQWKTWLERNADKVLTTDTAQDELWQAEQAAAKLEADKAYVLKHANEAAARYFQYWVGQRGLIDNQRTQHAIFDEFNKREKRDGAIPSAAHLDVVIELLNTQGVLEWKPVAPPLAPPVEPPPPPVLLADGQPQLPLGTIPRSSHSLAQLKDLDARERAERNRKVRESNGAVALAFRNAAVANTPALEAEVV